MNASQIIETGYIFRATPATLREWVGLQPRFEPTQDDVGRIVGEIDALRTQAMALMAHPYIDAEPIEWIVNPGVRFGGKHFAKVTPFEQKNLKGAELDVYLFIKRRQGVTGGWCKDSIADIAKGCGIATSTVELALDKLQKRKAIYKNDTKVNWVGDKPYQKPHWYRVNEPTRWTGNYLLTIFDKAIRKFTSYMIVQK